MRWAGHVWGRAKVYIGYWWGNLRERDHLEDSRHRWEDNIKMDLQEVGEGGMDWIDLVQDRDRWQALQHVVMNIWVPQNEGNFSTSCELVSSSQKTLLYGVSKY